MRESSIWMRLWFEYFSLAETAVPIKLGKKWLTESDPGEIVRFKAADSLLVS